MDPNKGRGPGSPRQLSSFLACQVAGASTWVNQGTLEGSRKLSWFIQPYEKLAGDP